MGNTCCSGKDCMSQEIRCEVDVYHDRNGRRRDYNGAGSDGKKPVQEGVPPLGGNLPALFFRDQN